MTTRTWNVLGLCGSLRRASYNTMALRAAAAAMPASMRLHEARLDDIPLYHGDEEREHGIPPAVLALRDAIADADAVLIASPEYNFSVSGVLKNAIDWLSRTQPQPWRFKPVALLSATLGPVGGARNQYELRKILACLEAIVLPRPEVFIGLAPSKFDADGALTDEATRQVIAAQMQAFEAWITRVGPG